ncbi:T9SS type A sorting domain-containing protein [Adhaeribacter swui]|uniref:T9SS type A sorting domain-containing protein n=1 Tax=Adhaeribacter swui TaxID=2086471 RepID=A0A7G7G4P6_9BACT|nr:T9SS type A sorting domain-containing protein [Adhaeribacter swui]QNF32130.1 T9SS type A sorting domain-containing protein [Adhaeribacter swui]
MKNFSTLIKKIPSTNYRWCASTAVLIFGLSLVGPAVAQNIQLDKTIGSYSTDQLASAQQTPDGGYILGGTTEFGKGGDKTEEGENDSRFATDYWIVKLKANGTKEWDKVYSGNAEDAVKKVLPTPDGGYMVFGNSNSGISRDKSGPSKGGQDFWIIKLRADGSKAWDKTIGGKYFDKLEAVATTQDGGYILGATSVSGIGKDKTETRRGRDDYWIVKLSADGTKEWDKTIGGPGDDRLSTIQQTTDGGYMVGGTSSSRIGNDKTSASHGKDDYWVVKLDATGAKVWDKSFGGSDNDYLAALQQTPDGSFILGGSSRSNISGNKSEKNKSALSENYWFPISDYWVVKIDATGKIIWDKTIGGNNKDQLKALQVTPDQNILLGGTSDSQFGEDKSEDPKGKFISSDFTVDDYWIVKLRPDGSKMWDVTIGGNSEDDLISMEPALDGSYILGGNSYSSISDDKTEVRRGGQDYWIVKMENKNLDSAAWNMAYGGLGSDAFTTAIQTRDSGYLSGGYSTSDSSYYKSQNSRGQNDFWIVKSNQYGQKIWDKRYGGSDNDYLSRVIQTQDGGYLLGGSSFSGKGGDKTQSSQGDRDYWVIKVDAQGNKQWDKRFGGTGDDELVKVVQLASGDYVLGGHSNSPTSGDKTQGSQGKTDYWLIKISKNGIKLWDKRYGGTAIENLGSFTETANGGFLLAGTSLSGQGHDKSASSRGGSDYWVVQTDQAGNLLWDKTYGGSGNDKAYSVGRSGNSFFLAGTSNSGANGDKTQSSRGGKDFWLIKISSTGDKLWDKRYGGTANDELSASSITTDGGIALAGKSNSGAGADKTQSNQGRSDYWLVQVDANGNLQWDQRFGGSRSDELRVVTQTQDGGFLLGGQSDSGRSGDKNQSLIGFLGTDYWLVKVAPRTAAASQNTPETTVEQATVVIKNFTAYPNPFRDRVTVSFTLPQTQAITVRVLDSQGHPVATLFQEQAQAHQKYEVQWQAGNQKAGMYLLQLQTPAQQNTLKLLLQK